MPLATGTKASQTIFIDSYILRLNLQLYRERMVYIVLNALVKTGPVFRFSLENTMKSLKD